MARMDHATVGSVPPPIPDHELTVPIGSGAYGEVWLARNAIGSLRAVKIVRRDQHASAESFEREFKGLQKFEPVFRTHEGLVDILTLGLLPEGAGFYYVMELADGVGSDPCSVISNQSSVPTPLNTDHCSLITDYSPRTLRADLKMHGALPTADVLALGLKLTNALAHLHAHGLVHRDVKPSNIILVGGQPKLADIGLVTQAATGDDARSIVGTEGYLAPEGPGAPTADVYALGKVLYETLTGLDRRQYPELPADVRTWPDAKLALELNAIVVRACAGDPGERYATAEAMRADLERLAQGRSVLRRRAWQRYGRCGLKLAATIALMAGVWLTISRFMLPTLNPQSPAASVPVSIFVLPFRNEGTNEMDALLRSRITDAITDGLALVEGVKVGPRKSGWARLDEDTARGKAIQQFSSRYTVSGKVRTSTNELALIVSMNDESSPAPGNARAFTSALTNRMAAERQTLEWIIRELGLKPAQDWTARLDRVLTNNERALELVQSWPWEVEYSKSGLMKCEAAFTQAVMRDKKFAEAHILLAATKLRLCDRQYSPRKVTVELERDVLDALELDDTLSAAYQGLGYVDAFFRWQWESGEAHFKRAVELDPTDYWARWNYVKFLRVVGRIEEARLESDRAYELNGKRHYYILAEQLYAERRFQEAAQVVKSRRAEASSFYDGDLLFAAGFLTESVAAFERTLDWDPSPEWISRLGFVHARSGNREKAEEALQELKQLARTHPYVSPYFLAVSHLTLGHTNECFAALNQAVTDQSRFIAGWGLYGLATDVVWDDIRSDPRFAALLDRVGLPPAARRLALQRKLASAVSVTPPAAVPNSTSP